MPALRHHASNILRRHLVRALQMSAQVGHLAGDLATEGAPGQTFVNLAVKRQRADVVVGAATDVAV